MKKINVIFTLWQLKGSSQIFDWNGSTLGSYVLNVYMCVIRKPLTHIEVIAGHYRRKRNVQEKDLKKTDTRFDQTE